MGEAIEWFAVVRVRIEIASHTGAGDGNRLAKTGGEEWPNGLAKALRCSAGTLR